MKKLLFSLAAAATCGVATAAPATATFDGATFDPTKADNGEAISESNLGYWEIDVKDTPELTAAGEDNAALGYLQINTGSTPLWRTFAGVDSHVSATNAALDAAAVDADGVVVSSDVKLTACTEWPTLTDFANEKLALFLFAPEEGDTSGKTNGLYAVGGAMVDGNLTATAYRLNAEPNAITNTDGWATIAIKSYADVYVNNVGAKYPAFVIAACAKGSTTTNILSVAAGEAYAPGFVVSNLSNAAKTRIDNRQLIPSALTSNGKLVGLGFQGEGGIDNVNLAAAVVDGMDDAVTMTVKITDGVGYSGITLGDNGAYSFTSTNAVTFTLNEQAVAGKIVTVDYTGTATYDESTRRITFTPVKDARLTITVEDAKFEVGGVKYGSLEDALKALANGGTLKLLGALELGANLLTFDQVDTEGEAIDFVLDLNGQTISGSGISESNYAVIVVAGANLTIKDSFGGGKILPLTEGGYAVWNTAGALEIQAGAYDGAVVTEVGATTSITGGKFKVTVEDATLVGGVWTQDGDYWTIGATKPAPSIKDGDGTIDEDKDGDYVVTPADNKTEVNITVGDYTGNVIVPPTVTKITGTIADAQIGVQLGVYKVIGAFKRDDGKIELNKDAKVKVGDEDIKVEPELADGATETPFVVGEKTEATVKTIPGLKYSLVWDSDLSFTSDVASGVKGSTEPVQATSNRMKLVDPTDKDKKPTKRFYKVNVTK